MFSMGGFMVCQVLLDKAYNERGKMFKNAHTLRYYYTLTNVNRI